MIAEIEQILEDVRKNGRAQLTEFEAKQVLAAAGIAGTREELAASEQEAVSSAQKLGFPVVLKISSPDILHKTDAGGVKIGLADDQAVRQGYQEIMNAISAKHPRAKIHGVLVQEMIAGGIQTILGVANRPPFGPVVAFGLGGVFVELLKDITLRLAPVDEKGAADMLTEIRGSKMLDGYRGQPAADRTALARSIARLSELAVKFHADIEELDINPLVVNADRILALDALITLKHKKGDVKKEPAKSSVLNDIRAVLEPKSLAVIGASTNPTKTGHVLLKNIVVNGFPGKVYPINPNADEIIGLKAYPKILDVPGDIDLVFFLLPGKFVPTLFEDCAKKGVKAAVIISAGFAEVGEEGKKEQEKLAELIRKTGVRCVGPNSIGFINMDQKLVASFILFENWEDGSIAQKRHIRKQDRSGRK